MRPAANLFVFAIVSFGTLALNSCSERGDVAVLSAPVRPTETQIDPPDPTPSPTPTPVPQPTATEVCFEREGQLLQTEYPSYILEGAVPIQIYLPPCYSVRTDDYPVLYTLHGYPLDESHWLDLGVVETFEEGLLQGDWEPFVVVMPFIPEDLNVHSDGGPGSYEEEFISGVIPYVEGGYRVEKTAAGRGLAGVSRGGIWALEIGLRNGRLFDTLVVLSPALHVNRPRAAYDPFQLILEAQPFPKHIFLSVGDDEGQFRLKTEEFQREMEENGIEHTYLSTRGAHVDATWIAIMPKVLRFITETWS